MDNQTTVISATVEASFNLEGKQDKKKASTNTLRTIAAIKALIFALIIGVLLIIATGQTSKIGDFFTGFYDENFSSVYKFTGWISTISYLIPLGLALAVSFRIGIFNIGAAGQAIAGGVVAAYVGANIDFGAFGWLVTIVIGVGVGMTIAWVIAFLKNRFKINEVISSIMINWIILYFVRFLMTGHSETIMILDNNDLRFEWLNEIMGGANANASVNLGILVMFPLVFFIWFAYNKTKWGYKQDLIGNNPNVGAYVGIKHKKEIYKAMLISGALAGFAGVVYYCGMANTLPDSSIKDIPAWSFNGITVALLGFNSPIGIVFSSMILGLFNSNIDQLIGDYGILEVTVATMIIFIAASNYRITYGKRRNK